MYPISNTARRKVVVGSAILCAVPLFLAPISGRSSFELTAERIAFTNRFGIPIPRFRRHAIHVHITRDPFVPEPAFVVSPRDVLAKDSDHRLTNPLLRAIVFGASPRALLEENGRVRIVGLGDAVDNSRVTSILSDSIRLQDGRTIQVNGEAP